VNSYFFYYFSPAPDSIPYFEVVACADDADAESRCRGVLAGRGAGSAEVWRGDRMVCRVQPPKPARRMPPAAAPPAMAVETGV
jgi:hypothetical protein